MTQKKVRKITHLILGLCFISLPSCMTTRHIKAQEVKTDLAIREMHSEIEQQKHKLTRLEVQLQIVEGKNESQSNVTHKLRKEIAKLTQKENQVLDKILVDIEQKLLKLKEQKGSLENKVLSLEEHTELILSYLEQHKEKIDLTEQDLLDYKHQLDQLNASVHSLQSLSPHTPELNIHTVQDGETLDKIAEKYQLSVDSLVETNQLSSDHLIQGQKLKLK